MFTAERLLRFVCVGRKTKCISCYCIDLQLDGPFIKVNDQMQTSAEGVYAVGDVAGGYQLALAWRWQRGCCGQQYLRRT
ncbi:FAD-dependent oxidoreductase [Bacillus sp. SL00103]